MPHSEHFAWTFQFIFPRYSKVSSDVNIHPLTGERVLQTHDWPAGEYIVVVREAANGNFIATSKVLKL